MLRVGACIFIFSEVALALLSEDKIYNITIGERNSTENGTTFTLGNGIVGLLGTFVDLTEEVGGLFGQFEDGFEKIQPENDTILSEEKLYNTTLVERNSTGNSAGNETEASLGNGIVGLFDTITGLTKEVGGLFGHLEDGFEEIQPETDKKGLESNITSNVTESPAHAGSIIVGLFSTLKDLTRDVSKLVSGVEESLTNRRQDVVDLAEHVEDEVQDLGAALENWVGSLEDGERNITWSLNHTMANGEVIQVANFTSSVRVTSLEDHETEDEELVEDIQIIE
eukprot:TRINITY_DN2013_c0_g1_i1.p1 TRINITY_DN2013_c0_g1~~TRINITY_DN2013_c0_g1_i1.p1  ORF type:complete len:282 (-),score=56.31 TRINITY_DN2013_c0_g1_i1:93-938(-)